MKNLMLTIALMFGLMAPIQSQATIGGFFKSYKDIKSDFRDKKIHRFTQVALNNLIEKAANILERRGYRDDAKRLRKEWNENGFSVYFLMFNELDVGDHEPISRWLADTYMWLDIKLGHEVLEELQLDDMNMFNYTIPVVFQPSCEEWDKIEYQLHFVEFAGGVTYWTTYVSCKVATSDIMLIGIFCGPLAKFFKKRMVEKHGPKISDKIYDHYNQIEEFMYE